jgi:signal transduction histidine kinase
MIDNVINADSLKFLVSANPILRICDLDICQAGMIAGGSKIKPQTKKSSTLGNLYSLWLINIANLYKKQHRTEEAINVYTQALDLAEYMTIRQQVNIYTNLGAAYNEWENFPKALHFLAVAERLANKEGGLTDRADVQMQLALAHRGMGNFEKAWQAQVNYTPLADSINVRMREQEIAELMMKYESAEKDIRILEQQHNLQQRAMQIQKRTLWLVGVIALVLAFSGILFSLVKRKEAAARQASVELRLAEQKEIARIQEERLRISRELHDNIGSYLTLLSASVEQVSAAHAVCKACKIPDLKDTLSMSMRELRKTVWLLNKDTIEVDEIAVRLRDFFKPLHQNGTKILITTEGDTQKKLFCHIKYKQLRMEIQNSLS